MKYILVTGLCLISFHLGVILGNTIFWPEGYQKGLADAIQWNCGEAVK